MQLMALRAVGCLLLEVIMNIKDEIRFQYLLTRRALKPFRVDIRALKEYNEEIVKERRKSNDKQEKV